MVRVKIFRPAPKELFRETSQVPYYTQRNISLAAKSFAPSNLSGACCTNTRAQSHIFEALIRDDVTTLRSALWPRAGDYGRRFESV